MTPSLEEKIDASFKKYSVEIFEFGKMLMCGNDAEATIRWCYLSTLFQIKATEYPELLDDDANVRSWLYHRMRDICLRRHIYKQQTKISWAKSISKRLSQLLNLFSLKRWSKRI